MLLFEDKTTFVSVYFLNEFTRTCLNLWRSVTTQCIYKLAIYAGFASGILFQHNVSNEPKLGLSW